MRIKIIILRISAVLLMPLGVLQAQVTSVTGSGTGISASPTTGSVVVTNTAPLTAAGLQEVLAVAPFNINGNGGTCDLVDNSGSAFIIEDEWNGAPDGTPTCNAFWGIEGGLSNDSMLVGEDGNGYQNIQMESQNGTADFGGVVTAGGFNANGQKVSDVAYGTISSDAATFGQLPAGIAAVSGQYLTGYNASTHTFSQAAFSLPSDIATTDTAQTITGQKTFGSTVGVQGSDGNFIGVTIGNLLSAPSPGGSYGTMAIWQGGSGVGWINPDWPNATILDANGAGGIVFNASAGSIKFQNSRITRMTFTNSGYLGIGTTTPAYPLEVNGSIKADNDIFVQTIHAQALQFPGGGTITTSGTQNIAIGGVTLPSSTTGDYNIAFGNAVLGQNTTGGLNTAIGTFAMSGNTVGQGNTAVGMQALDYNSTGNSNVAIGIHSLLNNSTGNANTATGGNALFANTSGSSNTSHGYAALANLTTGNANVAVGYSAGSNTSTNTQNQTSNNSVYVGSSTSALADGDTNETVIGAGATGAGSNTVTLGSTAVTTTVLQGNVGIGTITPSAKLEVNGNLVGDGTLTLPALGSSGALLCTGAGGVITSSGCVTPSAGTLAGTSLSSNVVSSALTSVGTLTSLNVSGSVGIGTTSPNSKLDVNGTVEIEGNGAFATSNGLSLWEFDDSSYKIGFDNQGGVGYIRHNIVANAPTNTWGHVFSTSQSGSSAIYTNTLFVGASGNVGIGTTTPGADLASLTIPPVAGTPILEVNGDIALAQNHSSKVIYADGSVQSTAWNGVLNGGDYAESMDAAGSRTSYQPGDVLVLNVDNGSDVAKSAESYSTLVAGIYATRPGALGRRQKTDPKISTSEIPMAMVGVVPTKVSAENGAIHRGDLLVTSSTPGYAMKGTDRDRLVGAVLGKAMGNLDSGTGVIEVLVTLQ